MLPPAHTDDHVGTRPLYCNDSSGVVVVGGGDGVGSVVGWYCCWYIVGVVVVDGGVVGVLTCAVLLHICCVVSR